MPTSVTIYEVGPRDGLQNESIVLPAGIKAEFVERLVDAGTTVVETASFVHPKLVPQLADAEEVLQDLGMVTGIDLQKMADTSVWLARQLGRPSPSRTVTALAG